MHWKGRRPEQRRDRREWVQCWAWVHGQVRVWRLLQSRLGIWHRLSLWHRDRGRLRRGQTWEAELELAAWAKPSATYPAGDDQAPLAQAAASSLVAQPEAAVG